MSLLMCHAIGSVLWLGLVGIYSIDKKSRFKTINVIPRSQSNLFPLIVPSILLGTL